MAVVALVCIAAGTWQIARFQQKVHENDHLRANAHQLTAPVGNVLPLLGQAAAAPRDRVEFRSVRATGTYDGSAQSLVRNRSVGDDNGFLVLTPLRTRAGVLLVVRGFVPQPGSGAVPAIPSPPSGRVTILARAHGGESRHDQAAQLPESQVESINPGDQAGRLRTPVFNGYVELAAHQPGSSGLKAMPAPDLSNPAGGALEPQHFAYVIQWYLFAALAVAAPFAMARAETRQRRNQDIDFDAASEPLAPSEEERRAAKLADRYGHAR
jgi:cytochrome oxidase assembly protein ShyY1